MLRLNEIKAQPGAHRNKKRLGRGSGSGHGVTAGKGDKGQLARSGGTVMPGFEGGQMPLFRRIPKQGFTNIWGRTEAEVSLASLEKFATALGGVANLETLKKVGAIKGRFDRLVILANGKLEKALVVEAHRVSAAAKNSIEKAGGKVNLIAVPSTGGKKKTKRSTRSAK